LGAAADGPPAEQQAVQIAVALSRHWMVDIRAGLPHAVVMALETALPHVQDPEQRCQALILLSFSNVLGSASDKAMAQAQQALELTSDARSRAQALLRLTHGTLFSAHDQSVVDAYVNEALALAQSVGDRETQALALRMRFLVTVNRDNDNVAGESMAEQVQALWEELGHRRNAYAGLMDRATCWIARGRLDEAATALAACEQVALQERFFTGAIMSSWQLGRVSIRLRQADAALAAFRRCLQGSWDLRRMAYVADALVLLPAGLAFTGRAEDAARLQGFAVAHWQRQFGTFYHEMKRDVCPTRRWLRQHLGPVRMEALRLEGSCMALIDAVALGLGSAER
jgi:tetratricopeptide (TPR) repeat protein